MQRRTEITEAKLNFRLLEKSLPGVRAYCSLCCAMSKIVVFNSFFSFAACELIMHPPCNELGSHFITRAVFSNNLLKTAAHFCPFVKLFLRLFKKKNTPYLFWYKVFFLSSYLNDIGRPAGFSFKTDPAGNSDRRVQSGLTARSG